MFKKQKIAFIINPNSGTGKYKQVEKNARELISKEKFDLSFFYTEYARHASQLSRKCLSENFNIVVAVGGDGTVHEVACELIHSQVKLAIIPTGSGNGIARHLNIPLSIQHALKLINSSNGIEIDTATINNKPFIMLAGCGFDALIAREFSAMNSRGLKGYLKLIVKNIFTYKAKNYLLTIDNKLINVKNAILVVVANCSQFGNNAYIAPQAKCDDAELNLTVLKSFPIWSLPKLLIYLFSKKIHLSHYTENYTGQHITISQSDCDGQIDGEYLECGKEIEIHVIPKSLKILVK